MTLQRSVIRSALVVGMVSLAAGVTIPALLSTSTLAPLLGIIVTGPIGAIAGALWGLVAAARRANAAQAKVLTLWLCGVWMITLAYTLFTVSLSPRLGAPALGLQVLVTVATGFFLYNKDIASKLPHALRHVRVIVMICTTFIVVTTAFPPAKPSRQVEIASTTLPRMAFIFDEQFDATHHVPLLSIHKEILLLEWVSAVTFAALAIAIVRRLRTK